MPRKLRAWQLSTVRAKLFVISTGLTLGCRVTSLSNSVQFNLGLSQQPCSLRSVLDELDDFVPDQNPLHKPLWEIFVSKRLLKFGPVMTRKSSRVITIVTYNDGGPFGQSYMGNINCRTKLQKIMVQPASLSGNILALNPLITLKIWKDWQLKEGSTLHTFANRDRCWWWHQRSVQLSTDKCTKSEFNFRRCRNCCVTEAEVPTHFLRSGNSPFRLWKRGGHTRLELLFYL